jgi:alpha-1,6-mannosyltransferase
MLLCDLTQFYSPVGGGVRRYISEKAKHLRAAGHRHLLIVPGEKSERHEEEGNILYTIASPLVSATARYRALLNLALIEEILEQERPDIIESGDPYQVAWKAIASGRGLGIPTVGFYHSHFPEATVRSVAKYFGGIAVLIAEEISRRYVASLYNRFQRTLVPSHLYTELLTTWGVENAVTLELGVDTSIFYPDRERGEAIRQAWSLPHHRSLLLYVGRLAPEKNVRILLEAFAELHNQHSHRYHLVVIGDGPCRGVLQRLSEKTGQVTWRSYCKDPAELADIYRAADLFIHPGIQETFGLVTLESQACGTPVLAIQGTSTEQLVVAGGPLGAARNHPLALAEAVEKALLTDLVTFGHRAAETVRERYCWGKVFERLFKIYQEVIAEYNP